MGALKNLMIDTPAFHREYPDDRDYEAQLPAIVLHNRLKRAIAKVLARSGVDQQTAEALGQRQANETVERMQQWEWDSRRVEVGGEEVPF